MKGATADWATGMANFSYVSLENALKLLHARQGSPPTGVPCLLARATRLGGIVFHHVNASISVTVYEEFWPYTSKCYLQN